MGTGARIVYLILGLVGMYRILWHSRQEHNPVGNSFPRLKLRVANKLSFSMPVTCGLFQPVIILPLNFREGSPEQQKAVLNHEWAHVKRWDNLTNLLAQSIVAFYWFNPLVWLVLAHLRILREKACDDYVLHTGVKPSFYAEILLAEIQKTCEIHEPVMSNFNSKGENRLKYILDSKVDHQLVSTKKRIAVIIGLGFALLPLAGLQLFAAVDKQNRPEIVFNPWQQKQENVIPLMPEKRASISTVFNRASSPEVSPQETAKSEKVTVPIDENPTTPEQQQETVETLRAEILDWQSKNSSILGTGEFVLPLQGRVTNLFGQRIHPVLRKMAWHSGIDIAAPHGSEIYAVDSGVVVFSGEKGRYGKIILIDHGNKSTTVYAHASELLVTTGQKVTKGEKVALVGSTGLSNGPHLHFEVRKIGVPQDPTMYIPQFAELPVVKYDTSTAKILEQSEEEN